MQANKAADSTEKLEKLRIALRDVEATAMRLAFDRMAVLQRRPQVIDLTGPAPPPPPTCTTVQQSSGSSASSSSANPLAPPQRTEGEPPLKITVREDTWTAVLPPPQLSPGSSPTLAPPQLADEEPPKRE